MSGDNQGSVTRWIAELKEGDRGAVQPLWERYFARMAELRARDFGPCASRTLAATRKTRHRCAFESLYAGLTRGKFPQLNDRDDLWRLLVVITSRKVLLQARRQLRQKRGGGNVRPVSDLPGDNSDDDDGLLAGSSAPSRRPSSP